MRRRTIPRIILSRRYLRKRIALEELIDGFDDQKRPYLAKPVESKYGQYGDYDHLSRYLEWSVREEDEREENDE